MFVINAQKWRILVVHLHLLYEYKHSM